MAEKLGANKSLADTFGKSNSPEFWHAEHVALALRQGKPVPAEALADYPDLKPDTKIDGDTGLPLKQGGRGTGFRRLCLCAPGALCG